ncbi:Hydrogenase maturation factor [Halogranum gelatinilyticum]|uniref:Hydrogenase maturation factor n=1 Tax=Halogranum gelatinilyticum TaxID=660521 RepID=A0A1G9Q4E8_9EURY|nr:AIR synthase family protein [Halogranum gelatinilyticum]SDM05377.1 Hydrogenase maturation factor [Halogranum gelatinilyticum]
MSELGKIDRAFFDEYVYPNLGAERDDVRLAPQHGVDFGVVDVGGKAVAMATDPVFVLPSLGFERAAWFAFHILVSDVAVSGLPPTHLAVDFNLPPEITDEQCRTLFETFDAEARGLGVSIVTGHTARYAGCNYPMVGGATSVAVGDHANLVRPDGARVGDTVVVTKGPAIEATGLLSIQFEPLLRDSDLAAETVEAAQDRFYDMSPVKDALVAAAAGNVTAMHDATECGVYGGLYELARAADVGIDIDRDLVPVMPGVREACDFFGIDPWHSISEGTLLATVDPDDVDAVLASLEAEGIPAAAVGTVVEGSGLRVDGEDVPHPEVDPFWGTFEEYMEKLGAGGEVTEGGA